jgi:hypothetical protein
MARRDLCRERARTGGLATGCSQLKAGRDGRVDAGSQAAIRTVPGNRDGMALGQDFIIAGAAKKELPLGKTS